MDHYTFMAGKFYGYPYCCIKWYSEERIEKPPSKFISLTKAQRKVRGYSGFIPCPECAQTVTPETLHTLIKDRMAPTPFPGAKQIIIIVKRS